MSNINKWKNSLNKVFSRWVLAPLTAHFNKLILSALILTTVETTFSQENTQKITQTQEKVLKIWFDSMIFLDILSEISKIYQLWDLTSFESRKELYHNVFGLKWIYIWTYEQNSLMMILMEAHILNHEEAFIKAMKTKTDINEKIITESPIVKELRKYNNLDKKVKEVLSDAQKKEIKDLKEKIAAERKIVAVKSKKIELLESDLEQKDEDLKKKDLDNKRLISVVQNKSSKNQGGETVKATDYFKNLNIIETQKKSEKFKKQLDFILLNDYNLPPDWKINNSIISSSKEGFWFDLKKVDDFYSKTFINGEKQKVKLEAGKWWAKLTHTEWLWEDRIQNTSFEFLGDNSRLSMALNSVLWERATTNFKVAYGLLYAWAQAWLYIEIEKWSELEKIALAQSFKIAWWRLKLSMAFLEKVVNAYVKEVNKSFDANMTQNAYWVEYTKFLSDVNILNAFTTQVIYYDSKGEKLWENGYVWDLIKNTSSEYDWNKVISKVVGWQQLLLMTDLIFKVSEKFRIDLGINATNTKVNVTNEESSEIWWAIKWIYRYSDKNFSKAEIWKIDGKTVASVSHTTYWNHWISTKVWYEKNDSNPDFKNNGWENYSAELKYTFWSYNKAPELFVTEVNDLTLDNTEVNKWVATNEFKVMEIVTSLQHTVYIDKTKLPEWTVLEKDAEGRIENLKIPQWVENLKEIVGVTPSEYASFFSIDENKYIKIKDFKNLPVNLYRLTFLDESNTYSLFEMNVTEWSKELNTTPRQINKVSKIIADRYKDGEINQKIEKAMFKWTLNIDTVTEMLDGTIDWRLVTHYINGDYSEKVLNWVTEGNFTEKQIQELIEQTMTSEEAERFAKKRNSAPTDITLSGSEVNENTEITIGALTATDEDINDIHSFKILSQTVDWALEITTKEVNWITQYILQTADASLIDYDVNETLDVEIEVEDKAWETYSKTITLEVTWSENTVNTPTYSTTVATNSDVIVTITTSKDIPDTGIPTGWTKVDSKTFTKVYSENTTETVTFTDSGDEEISTTVTINNIDKTAPNSPYLTSEIPTLTNQSESELVEINWDSSWNTQWDEVYLELVKDDNDSTGKLLQGTLDSNLKFSQKLDLNLWNGTYVYKYYTKDAAWNYSLAETISIEKFLWTPIAPVVWSYGSVVWSDVDSQTIPLTGLWESSKVYLDWVLVWTTGSDWTLDVSVKIDNIWSNEFEFFYIDKYGNISTSLDLIITKTSTAPSTPTLTISDPSWEAEAEYTKYLEVAVNISDVSWATAWFLSESPTAPWAGDAGWVSVKPTTFTMSSWDWEKTVYAYVKNDYWIVQSVWAVDTINLDRVAPTKTESTLPTLSTWTSSSGTFKISEDVTYVDGSLKFEDEYGNDVWWSFSNVVFNSETGILSYDCVTPNYTGNLTIVASVKDKANNIGNIESGEFNLTVDFSNSLEITWDTLSWADFSGASYYYVMDETWTYVSTVVYSTSIDVSSVPSWTNIYVVPYDWIGNDLWLAQIQKN